jgi:RecJ-like exonuclease
MTTTVIEVAIENDIGVERTLRLPAVFEVCGRCDGEGKHVNPAIDEHGITQEEFDEDPGFEEEYFGGTYDVTCYDCHGKCVVPVLDELSFKGTKAKERLFNRVQEKFDADAAYELERRHEERMGY